MRKILPLIGLCLALLGCQKPAPVQPRAVIAVQTCCRNGDSLRRGYYTQDEKVRRLLYCLRQQPRLGYAPVDPERLTGPVVELWLHYTDGSVGLYILRSGRYASRDRHRWYTVSREGENRLLYLLQLMPPDPVANAGAS